MGMDKRQKPDRPLRVVLIGCGRASRAHLRAIGYFEKRGFYSLEGLVDRDSRVIGEVLMARGRSRPVPATSDNLKDLLGKRIFDLAVIATPP